jgi:hypothetical protein
MKLNKKNVSGLFAVSIFALSLSMSTFAFAQEMPIGDFTGAIPPPPGGMPPGGFFNEPKHIVAEVLDGKYIGSSKPAEAKPKGNISDTYIANLQINSSAPDTNGVVINGGKSAVTIDKPSIKITGIGSDDNSGVAAGVLSTHQATTIVKNAHIETYAAVSSATAVVKSATLRVYDSYLYAHGGPLPKDYVPKIGPGMLEAPAPLGIKGTARTTIATSGGQAYYYNTKIIADGWGALSTDAAGPKVYVEANDCEIIVKNSGYGTYADNGAEVVVNRSQINTATFTGIIAGSGITSLNDVNATSGESGIMIHNVMGGENQYGVLNIKGGNYQTNGDVIKIKSANAEITLDNPKIKSLNGNLIHGLLNDDPNATKVNGQVRGINVAIKNSNLIGNVLHEDNKRFMTLSFANSNLKGAIFNAGLNLDENSKWLATGKSQVYFHSLKKINQIDALEGVTIDAKAADNLIAKGDYKLKSGGILKIL